MLRINRQENGYWSFQEEKGMLAMNDLELTVLTEEEFLASSNHECKVKVKDNHIQFTFDDIEACIDILSPDESSLVYNCKVTNISEENQRIISVTPIGYKGDWCAEGYLVMSNSARVLTWPAERGYGSSGTTGVLESKIITSFWQLTMHDPLTGNGFLTGIYGVPQGMVRYRSIPLIPDKEGFRTMQWSCEVDMKSGARGVCLKPGCSISTGLQYIKIWNGSMESGVEDYGDMLAEVFNCRHRNYVPTGWCSWYAGYYLNINEQEMLENLKHVKNTMGLEYFQIDDGWTTPIGTRTLGEQFLM